MLLLTRADVSGVPSAADFANDDSGSAAGGHDSTGRL